MKETLTFWEFCEKLSEQMMAYKSADRVFPGDEKMREVVAQNKRQQKRGRPKEDDKDGMSMRKLRGATHNTHKVGRLCNDLSTFQKHIDSVRFIKNGKSCEVCGITCYTVCGLCGD